MTKCEVPIISYLLSIGMDTVYEYSVIGNTYSENSHRIGFKIVRTTSFVHDVSMYLGICNVVDILNFFGSFWQ